MLWPKRLSRVIVAAVLALTCAGCFLIRQTVNDSPSIRWWLFSNFGASRVCPEMIQRGVPLTIGEQNAADGRFFPTRCDAKIDNARKILLLNFGGTGYVWTPLAGRIAFDASAAVNYRPDFVMTEDALYVWGRVESIPAPPTFRVLSIENPVVNWAAQGPPGYLATHIGKQLMTSRISDGFTVVRSDAGDDFTLGLLQPPARPSRPFATAGEATVLANESVTLHSNQVDFLGPLRVEGAQQILSLQTRSEGPPAEMHLMHRTVADEWRRTLDLGSKAGPPAGAILRSWALSRGEQQVAVPLNAGHYTLVIDNSAKLGSVSPAWSPLPGLAQAPPLQLSIIAQLRAIE